MPSAIATERGDTEQVGQGVARLRRHLAQQHEREAVGGGDQLAFGSGQLAWQVRDERGGGAGLVAPRGQEPERNDQQRTETSGHLSSWR
jgi:hypothetical protein